MKKIIESINRCLAARDIPQIRIEVLDHTDPYSFCRVVSVQYPDKYVGTGYAKRNPIDPPHPFYGRKLALNRAVSAYVDAYYGSMQLIAVAKMLTAPSLKETISV